MPASPAQSSPASMSIPGQGVAFAPGTYETEIFQPTIRFTIGEGWVAPIPEMSNTFGVSPGSTSSKRTVGFFHVESLFNNDVPSGGADVIDWIRNHTELDVAEPSQGSVGGVEATILDVKANPEMKGFMPGLFQTEAGSYVLESTGAARIYVLEIGGEPVAISIEAPAKRIDAFVPLAEEILSTVEFPT